MRAADQPGGGWTMRGSGLLLAAGITAWVAVQWGGWPLAVAAAGLGWLLLAAETEGDDAKVETSRWWQWGGWGLLLVLVAKDLAPTWPPSGAAWRTLGWEHGTLRWPGSARNPTLGWGAAHMAALLGGWCLILLLRFYLARSADRLRSALRVGALCLAALGAAIAVVCWRTPDYGQELYVGVVRNKNGAGSLVMLGVLAHALWSDVARRESRVVGCLLHAGVALALLWPLVQLKSWTALVGLATGVAAYGLVRLPGGFRSWLLVGGLGGVLALGLATLEPRLANRTVDMVADYRLEIWRDLWPLLRSQPWFGHGLGAFEFVYPLAGTFPLPLEVRLVHPDSSLAKGVVEWGIVPALVLAVGVGLGLRHALRAIRRLTHDPATQSAGAMALALACAWGATGVTDVTWHRPETFLAGVLAVGILAGAIAPRGVSPPRGGSGRWGFGFVLLASVGLAVWSQVVARGNLRWNGLDPEAFWRRAEQTRVAGGAVTEQAKFYEASAQLQHRSVAYPLAAARRLQAQDREVAFAFWVTALQRARGAAWDEMEVVLRDFVGTPVAYWQRVAVQADVDLLLLVRPSEEREALELLEQWVDLMKSRPTVAAPAAGRFLNRIEDIRAWRLLGEAADALPVPDRTFWWRAAGLLRRAGNLASAWRAAQHLMPQLDAGALPPKSGLAHLPPEALIEVRAFGDLQHWMLQAGEAEAERKLKLLLRLNAAADVPVWFAYFLAAEHARHGDWESAVDQILTATERLESARRNN